MILRPLPRPTFEPPRAGAMRSAWNAWYAFLRRTHLRLPRGLLVRQPLGISWESVAVVVIPAYGWAALDKPAKARWAALAYGVCALLAIVCLGWNAAGWVAGIMITLHGLGIAEYFYSRQDSFTPAQRIARYVGVVLAVALAYTVVSRRLLATVVVPLQTDRGVLLIDAWTRPDSVAREETVAFRSQGWRAGHFMLRGGIYLGRVFGRPDDVIAFRADTFAVNGQAYPRRPSMPRRGELTVPVQHTFIWPLDLRREFAREEEAADFARQAALVPDADLVGRPYQRWFFRKQNHEPLR